MSQIPPDLLKIGVGGDITLEEKLLLKSSGDLGKYSFTASSPTAAIKPPPRSAGGEYLERKIKVYDSKPRAFIEYLIDLNLQKEDFSTELEKYISKQETRFQNTINNIKCLLEREKVTNRKLRHAHTKKMGTQSTKSDMMSLFSGVVHDPAPSQTTATGRRKFSGRIMRPRGKTAGSSRIKKIQTGLVAKPKLAYLNPRSQMT